MIHAVWSVEAHARNRNTRIEQKWLVIAAATRIAEVRGERAWIARENLLEPAFVYGRAFGSGIAHVARRVDDRRTDCCNGFRPEYRARQVLIGVQIRDAAVRKFDRVTLHVRGRADEADLFTVPARDDDRALRM